MSVVTIAYLKTRFETGDFPTEQDFIDLIDTLAALPSGGGTYTKYVARLYQSGTGAPTVVFPFTAISTISENTIGTIVWTRTGVGTYRGTLAAAFTQYKTWMLSTSAQLSLNTVPMDWETANSVVINSVDDTGTNADDLMNGVFIEIRVYP